MDGVMMHILLARQHSADELRQGEEGRDGNEGWRGHCRSGWGKIRHRTWEPLHTPVGQSDHEPGLGACGVYSQQWERTPVQRMRRIDNGHLTSRRFRL
jgi:hypothetical protein